MITSSSIISSNSIALLFGTTKAPLANSDSPAAGLLADVTGNTDDVFKAGNAIGNIIEIASRINQEDASAKEKVNVEQINLANDQGRRLTEFDLYPLYGVKGTFTTTYHGNGERTEVFVGSFMGKTDEAYRQIWIDGLKRDQSTLQKRTMLAAFESNTIQETDIAELGFKSELTMTADYHSDGRAEMRVNIDISAMLQFREQYTETRNGVLYDKATGKFADMGQNGNKFIYYTW